MVISVYRPDLDNENIQSVEEYVSNALALTGDEGSGITKYGKTSGYKLFSSADGKKRIDFIVKGVNGFFRFAVESSDPNFSEENEIFRKVMDSIRIDDGNYNKLSLMSNRYTLLLEYAMNMEYITSANYANHCLNNFESTGDVRHKEDALNSSADIRAALSEIINYKREPNEGYDDVWFRITSEAKVLIDACERMEKAIADGDYKFAQAISRSEFDYDLSDLCTKFLATINAEIAEY